MQRPGSFVFICGFSCFSLCFCLFWSLFRSFSKKREPPMRPLEGKIRVPPRSRGGRVQNYKNGGISAAGSNQKRHKRASGTGSYAAESQTVRKIFISCLSFMPAPETAGGSGKRRGTRHGRGAPGTESSTEEEPEKEGNSGRGKKAEKRPGKNTKYIHTSGRIFEQEKRLKKKWRFCRYMPATVCRYLHPSNGTKLPLFALKNTPGTAEENRHGDRSAVEGNYILTRLYP